MPKKIILIGVGVPGDSAEYTPLRSKLSLLDFDIAVIDPSISQFYGNCVDYLGKPCLTDSNSFQLREHIEHWRREILEVAKAGKTLFMLMNKHDEVFVATGEESFSGTGRNRQTTRQVTSFSNYQIVPGGIEVINSEGKSMRLSDKANLLSEYWSVFGEMSEFRVLVSGQGLRALVVTKSGNKTVGAYLRYKNASGALVLLPYITFDRDEFWCEKDDETHWTDQAVKLGSQFISSLVGVDKALREATERTPPPEWVAQEEYVLPKEQAIREKLLTIETKIEGLQNDKEQQEKELSEEALLKGLLFEKGKTLEAAILEALRLLGFSVSQYRDNESEFDVVFEGEDGRFIAEAEGKDNNAINISKLRQLEMNIHEDFDRDVVNEMANGVLIGNAYRLSPPEQRDAFFTQKCLTAADRSKTALLRSVDLFFVAKYLSRKKDQIFAKKCRKAILNTVGVVEFPTIPEDKGSTTENIVVQAKS